MSAALTAKPAGAAARVGFAHAEPWLSRVMRERDRARSRAIPRCVGSAHDTTSLSIRRTLAFRAQPDAKTADASSRSCSPRAFASPCRKIQARVNRTRPILRPACKKATFNAVVETAQVAPTVLRILDLDPTLLAGVQNEGTRVLPGL